MNIGDGPIDPNLSEMMNDVALTLDKFFNGNQKPKTNGFILMVFPFDTHEGRCNYISNGSREDIIVLLKEQLAYFSGQAEIKNDSKH